MEMSQPRGMRDSPPEEKLVRDEVVATLKRVFERYGFAPLETPLLERFDVLSAKYAGGAEILKETFTLQDQGKRKLGLRYDLTVPLARFVAMNPNVKLPFKRYQIEKVYRDGPIKLGRYREFYQCDVDTVGVNSAAADAQIVQTTLAAFTELGIKVTLAVNNIELLKAILTEEGVPEKKLVPAMLILDKLKKIGAKGVTKELRDAKIAQNSVVAIEQIAKKTTNNAKITAITKKYGDLPGVARITEILALVPDTRVVFDPSLSRGLAYYTGVVFEAYAVNSNVTSSLAGGGRYDEMIGNFIGRTKEYPATGISFGLEPIMEVLRSKGRPAEKTRTRVFVIPIQTPKESNELAETLRAAGINTDIDLFGRSISKNLDYVNALGIPYAVILGKRELEKNVCTLKDMKTGDERQVKQSNLVRTLT